jgi:GT2 family glycosyltransferase
VTSEAVIGIVPASVRSQEELDRLARCLASTRSTAPALALLIAETGWSDSALAPAVAAAATELGLVYSPFEHAEPSVGAAVAGGMGVALELGCAAVVIDPDVEFRTAGWLERMLGRTDTQGRPAAVVGARTVYDGGIVDQAGIYFSLFERKLRPRYRSAPAGLPAASAAARCPVAAGAVLVRLQTLQVVGRYDDACIAGQETTDYCLRTFDAGLECILEPAAEAVRLRRPGAESSLPEPAVRRSESHFTAKHRDSDLSQWIPAVL